MAPPTSSRRQVTTKAASEPLARASEITAAQLQPAALAAAQHSLDRGGAQDLDGVLGGGGLDDLEAVLAQRRRQLGALGRVCIENEDSFGRHEGGRLQFAHRSISGANRTRSRNGCDST